MCIILYVCEHFYMCMSMCACAYGSLHMCTYVLCLHIYFCAFVCMYARVCVHCEYASVFVCVSMCKYNFLAKFYLYHF